MKRLFKVWSWTRCAGSQWHVALTMFILFASSAAIAAADSGLNPVLPDTAEQVQQETSMTRARRGLSEYFVLGSYAPIDLVIPSKFGVTAGLKRDVDITWELEYLRGSLSIPFLVKDLGKISDERYSFIVRSYGGRSSFNYSYGISYFDMNMHLGNDLLNRVSDGNYPSVDLVQAEALGVNVGLGNRWNLDHNITIGIDWISWSQPLVITKQKSAFLDVAMNPQDKEDVETALRVFTKFPRFSFLKLQIGILF